MEVVYLDNLHWFNISKVLVLDEATAAVDTATDERIQTTIRFLLTPDTYVCLAVNEYDFDQLYSTMLIFRALSYSGLSLQLVLCSLLRTGWTQWQVKIKHHTIPYNCWSWGLEGRAPFTSNRSLYCQTSGGDTVLVLDKGKLAEQVKPISFLYQQKFLWAFPLPHHSSCNYFAHDIDFHHQQNPPDHIHS